MSNINSIAKNTAFLYLRMFFILGVTLYTSRIVLDQLGVSDYGIYSLVGGIVSMLSFFRGAMANATRRYLSFDIGKGDFERLKKTFSATLTIHFIIAIVVLILAETIGLWYLTNKMVFPENRLFAVQVVYQFSVLTFLINILQVPYDALLQAREKMKIYAIVSIVEAFLKLAIVYVLIYFGSDKLVTFSILTFFVALIIRLIYQFYCRNNFVESKYQFEYDKQYFKELLTYSGWNLFGSLAVVARGQGSNVILNLFFGTTINAAYGITTQIQMAVQLFVNNFQLAINPQIIKTYAQGDLKQNHRLIIKASKLSYFLLFIIICPIWFNIDYILQLWLKNIPEYTPIFVKLVLIYVLIDTISGPLMVGAQATGKIKFYQIIVGTLLFLNLPISYFLLKECNMKPMIVFDLMIILSIITLFFRIWFLKNMINLSVKEFITKVLLPILFVSIVSIVIIFLFIPLFKTDNQFVVFLFRVCTIFIIICPLIATLGLHREEKYFLKAIFLKKTIKKQ
ncbi:MATE family efflux transporter [Chryseobacterium aahli]|uniref:lipopolysaccharide biosynthesis protein n=1 Tax=Chryseobacterium aahli TaxID=1278643 RepID=UPI001F61B3B2|nr:oligosaccharide flippase family protein [Chryseobacterium aahli]MCI3936497.1 MATE family efflux transporter [Chryseobacterium aahli]